ncbi:hypothetical protein RF11_13020 [Thelohanellus kitauei]|uniref:Uncharacterized protein n=1 Tax=Thelohanellus kitauei TaxID=669202 RepID=A0A0C2NDT7_THEKT|nr:hypothetical protein RF11_13020 [Thelohanellus kitauei]
MLRDIELVAFSESKFMSMDSSLENSRRYFSTTDSHLYYWKFPIKESKSLMEFSFWEVINNMNLMHFQLDCVLIRHVLESWVISWRNSTYKIQVWSSAELNTSGLNKALETHIHSTKSEIFGICDIKRRNKTHGISAQRDNDDPSIFVGFQFMKGIPSPPPFLHMKIVLTYYDLTNSTVVEEDQESYYLLLEKCDLNPAFQISYGSTENQKIDRNRVLETLIEVIKRHGNPRTKLIINRYPNEIYREICYVTYHGRRFVLRLAFNGKQQRPVLPVVEINIKVFKRSTMDEQNPFIEYRMSGWQTICQKYFNDSIIDNPIIVYEDAWENLFNLFSRTWTEIYGQTELLMGQSSKMMIFRNFTLSAQCTATTEL